MDVKPENGWVEEVEKLVGRVGKLEQRQTSTHSALEAAYRSLQAELATLRNKLEGK
jgi:hypothetical protein